MRIRPWQRDTHCSVEYPGNQQLKSENIPKILEIQWRVHLWLFLLLLQLVDSPSDPNKAFF